MSKCKTVFPIFFILVVTAAALLIANQQAHEPSDNQRQRQGRPVSIGPEPAPARGLGIEWAGSLVYDGQGPYPVDLEQVPDRILDPNNKLARGWGHEGKPKRITRRISEEEADRLRSVAMLMPPSRGLMVPSNLAPPQIEEIQGFPSLDITDCCGGGANVPPDSELAVGPDYIIAVVNVAFAIYDKSGALLRGPITFASFFSETPGCDSTALFDPSVLYDEAEDRFFLGIDGNGTDYCFAASVGPDPLGLWNRYSFGTDFAGAFFDFPHAGVGRDAIYMGSNQFGGSLPGGFEGRVFAIDKYALYSGAPVVVVSQSTGFDGTPQPVNLHGFAQNTWPAEGPHYILTEVFDGALHTLWSWDDPFGSNKLTRRADIDLNAATGITAGFPVDAPQMGADTLIQANDWRGLDAEYRNGSIWMTNTIACNPDLQTVNCIRWAKIDPRKATVQEAGVIASSGEYRLFPDVAVNRCGDLAIGYTMTSKEQYPGVYVAMIEDGRLQQEVLLKTGELPYAAFDTPPYRWGDYSGMTIDVDGERFWYLGEYSKSTTSKNGRWGTHVASFVARSCGACRYQDELVFSDINVSGKQEVGACNAITLGPNVTVSSGEVVLVAGRRVVFGTGFRARRGASVTARIDRSLALEP